MRRSTSSHISGGKSGGGGWRAITVEAKSLDSARRLYDALSGFNPELLGDHYVGYRVLVELGTERRIVEVLNAIEAYVTETDGGAFRIDVGGRRYTMNPAGD